MSHERGNFLLQALLALSVIFAFVPFLAGRLSMRDSDAKMYTATRQVENVSTAARIFIRENANNLPYNRTVVTGNALADLLEPYGLPLGFSSRTGLGQDIALVIEKTPTDVFAHIELTGGDLSELQRAELARRIGFYAALSDVGVNVGIALENIYSDVVRRNEPNINENAFLTDLNMGEFTLDGAGAVFANRGDFETAQFDNLAIFGVENGRKVRNNITYMSAVKTVFQSRTGESALSLSRGTLSAKSISARTIAKFGDTGNFTAQTASLYDFSMTAGRTGFSGPAIWNVRGNVVTNNVSFSVDSIEINSFINATRGQDVYISYDDLETSSKSGMETDYMAVANITLRNQTSDALSRGDDGAVLVDVRPGGTSILPDALIDTINNDAFQIIDRPASNDGKTVDCKSIIGQLGGKYNQKSLSQYLICEYVYWVRLEKRIDIKQCLMAGKSGCI